MKQDCDVLVVGLGPGGAAAATHAARGGATVVAVERKKEIGEPVQCAEFVPMPIGKYVEGKNIIRQRVHGMQSYLPSGAVHASDNPGYIIDRKAFDQALAQMAADAGAELHTRTSLEGLNAQHKTAVIHDAAGTHRLAYRYLIAADGPYSKVAELLGLPRHKVVHSRQYTVPLRGQLQDMVVWLSPDCPGGYAWLYPRGELANLGLGLDHEFERDARHPLDELHRQLREEGVVGPEIVRRSGGAIPIAGLREKLVVDDVLFVGDAAGLTHPITGAGISASVVSGERAGQAAADALKVGAPALADFESDIRTQFGPGLDQALRARRALEWVWATPAAYWDDERRPGWVAFDEYAQA